MPLVRVPLPELSPLVAADDKTGEPSVERRAGIGAAWIAVEMIGGQGLSIVVFSVMAHFIGPREFGLVSLSFVLLYSLRWVLSENIALAIVRKAHGTDLEYTTAFWLTLALSVLSFLVFELFSLLAGWLFHAPDIGPIIQAMGIILIFMGLARTHEAWMTRNFRFKSLALRSLVASLLGGTAGLSCAVLHMGVWALVAQQVVLALSSLLFLWLATPWRPTVAFSTTAAREILCFVRSVSANSAITAFNDGCDTLLVAFFNGPASVGLYSTAKRLKLAMHLVAASPVSGATLPALAEVQHDEARFQRLILQTSRILLAITCPIFLGAAAISRDLIPLLFGARWAPASDIFSLLSVAGLLSLMVNFFGTVLLIKKYENWVLYFSGAYTVLIFIVFFALRSLHQASLAMPFLLPYLVIFPASLMKFLMVSGLSPVKWLQSVAAPVVSAALMTVVVLLTGRLLANLDAAPRLIISILGGGAIYVGLMSLAARDLVDGIAEIVRRRLS